MNKIYSFSLLALFSLSTLLLAPPLSAHDSPLEDQAEEALDSGEYKEAIEFYQRLHDEATSEDKPIYLMKLAGVYYKDQQQEQAFRVFLESLATLQKPEDTPVLSGDERDLYNEGLNLYLNQEKEGARKVATEIRQKYSPIVALNQDYYYLNYLVSASYANLGMYPEFFTRFFSSYSKAPDVYMAHKTMAILHIKLFERARDSEEREKQRDQVLSYMLKALDSNPNDTGLYKLIIGFAKDEERKNKVRESLNRILDQNIVIPRREIFFYVQSAISTGQQELAGKFLDKAGEWYTYSRSLAAAHQLLEKNQTNSKQQ